MKRLRHPIRAIREPFGTAGLVVACVALIAALGGTALAAAKLNSTQKKEVEKIAKKYAGKPGAPGATGPAGAVGTAGPKGDTGAKGDTGNAGTAGKSVTVTAIQPEEGKCEERAGAEVKGEGSSTVEVCNGENGAPGPEGSPWTELGVLPPGQTETGVWSFSGTILDGEELLAPISFSIPLKVGQEPEGGHIHFQGQANFAASCEHAEPPTAKPGELCIYNNPNSEDALLHAHYLGTAVAFSGPNGEEPRSGPSGALLQFMFTGESGEVARGYGTWAVTAPAQ